MSKYLKLHPSYQEDPLIFEIVEAAKSFYGMTDANLYFGALCDSRPEFVCLSNNVYRFKDYYIQVGKRLFMAGHGNCLMGLSRLELSCLPQGIGLIWLDNNEDMVLITRIPGSEGHRLAPYSGLSPQMKQRLLGDVDRLLEENYALLTVTEGKDSWHVLEGQDRIIFSHCDTAFVPDGAKPAYRCRVLDALDLHE